MRCRDVPHAAVPLEINGFGLRSHVPRGRSVIRNSGRDELRPAGKAKHKSLRLSFSAPTPHYSLVGALGGRSNAVREPLLLPAVALAAGIAAQRSLGWHSGELWPALAVLVGLAMAGHRLGLRAATVLACLAGLATAGALRMAAISNHPAPELDAVPGELLLFTGCVIEPPTSQGDRIQFLLELEPGARARVNVYLRPGQPAPPIRYGQRVELEGRFRPVRNFQNPGSFDYASYLARKDIYWTISANAKAPVRVLAEDCGNWLHRRIHQFRLALTGRIERMYSNRAYTAAMLEAILIGVNTGLETVWVQDWRRTGTYHALVVSGLQISVLAAVFLFMLRLCALPQALSLTLTAATAWLYAAACGADPPVLRAAAGFTLFALARALYRRVRLLNLLAAVAIAFLLADPQQLLDPSFQLSFLAVAAIGALAVPLLEASSLPVAKAATALADRGRDPGLEPRVAHIRVELRLLVETVALWSGLSERRCTALITWPLRAGLFFYELLVVSAAIQVGLALPMALYFHRLSLSGLSANLIVGPLMSVAVPVGFLAVLLGKPWLAWAAELPVEVSKRVVEFHAKWEPNWRIPDPPLWLSLALCGALLGLAWGLRRNPRIWRAPVGALVALLVALVLHPFPPELRPGTLELAMLDVGQGESLLVAMPEGSLALVDGGGFPGPSNARQARLDIGEDVVSPYLWRRGIKRLDVIIATHGHSDHIGGLPAIVENFRPRELWFGAMPESPSWRQLLNRAVQRGVRPRALRAGDKFRFGQASVEVLAPASDYQPGPQPHNNDSLVLLLSYGRHRWLLTGDIEREAEADLMARCALGKLDVLKVAHHGSRTSTGAVLLDLTRPALALISAGWDNPYNLPHPALLERLAERRILALRTSRHGLIRVASNGRWLELETAQWGQ